MKSDCTLPLLMHVLLMVVEIKAIPIDNGVIGDPEIECGPTAISVSFSTFKAFKGHVYVKGFFYDDDCRSDEGGRSVAIITVAFSSCGLVRTRSVNPKGVIVLATVVVSFHPKFVTKVDRAFRISCFYMESSEDVGAKINISEITTASLTRTMPMPICKYDILDGGPDRLPVQYGKIGQQVYHQWSCSSEAVDTFCMLVHSCFVDDGNGDRVEILDSNGCAVDRYVLNNLEYPGDLLAGQEAHIYKYADRNSLFYQCQISLTIKNQECSRPVCMDLKTSSPAAVFDKNRRRDGLRSFGVKSSAEVKNISSFGAQRKGRPIAQLATKTKLSSSKRHDARPLIRVPRIAEFVSTPPTESFTVDVRTEMIALDFMDQGSAFEKTDVCMCDEMFFIIVSFTLFISLSLCVFLLFCCFLHLGKSPKSISNKTLISTDAQHLSSKVSLV